MLADMPVGKMLLILVSIMLTITMNLSFKRQVA
jgi:hypothetical protein